MVSSILPPTSAIAGYTIKGELLISPCICLPQQPARLTSAIAGYGTEAEPLTSPCICLPKLPASLTSAIFGYAVQRELLIYPHICLPKLPARLTSAIAGYVAETSLTSAIAGYVAEASLTAAIAGYVAETSLTSAKAGYVVEVELLICPCICLPKLLACLMLSVPSTMAATFSKPFCLTAGVHERLFVSCVQLVSNAPQTIGSKLVGSHTALRFIDRSKWKHN